jgi:hypothetical protein
MEDMSLVVFYFAALPQDDSLFDLEYRVAAVLLLLLLSWRLQLFTFPSLLKPLRPVSTPLITQRRHRAPESSNRSHLHCLSNF